MISHLSPATDNDKEPFGLSAKTGPKKGKKYTQLLIAISAVCLSACSSFPGEQAVNARSSQAQSLMKDFTDRAVSADLIQNDAPRVSGEEVKLKTSSLPRVFSEPISYRTQGNQSFMDVLENLSGLLGIALSANELGVLPLASNSLSAQSSVLPISFGVGQSPNALGRTTPFASSSSSSWLDLLASTPLNLNYHGSAKGLMDDLARRISASWRFNSSTQSVEFYRYETKTVSLALPPGAKRISAGISLSGVSGGASATVGSAGASSSAGSAGNVSVSQTLNINPWISIMQGIQSILNESSLGVAPQSAFTSGANAANTLGSTSSGAVLGSGAGLSTGLGGVGGVGGSAIGNSSAQALTAIALSGEAIANPELGLITITAKPATLLRIERYVSAINERFAHNVLIDVKIFSVSLDEQHSLGFGLNLLYKPLSALGATISTPSPLQAGADTPGVLTFSAPNASARFSGSNVVAQALSQFGKVSLQKQGQVLAVNGQPSPIQVANEITYVTSSTTTTAANVGTSVTQNTGTLVVGFTANFIPLILGDNRILLSYQMQISSLASPLTPNAQGIQTPNIASQSLQQQAFLNDGQAIVLFGFDEQSDGLSQALSWGGASIASNKARQMVVIVVEVNAGFKHA